MSDKTSLDFKHYIGLTHRILPCHLLFCFCFCFYAECIGNKSKYHSQKRELEIYCFILEMDFSEVEPSLKLSLKVEVEED